MRVIKWDDRAENRAIIDRDSLYEEGTVKLKYE